MLWRMLKCAVSADSRPIKAPHRTRFKTLSTAVDSWNGRLMIIMFCILKHSTLAKNSRQGWDLFIGMIPILQELQVLILFIPVVFFEHLELQRWPGQRSCRRTEFDSAALTGKQFKHICGTPVRDALKRCPRLHCLSDTIRYSQVWNHCGWNVNIKIVRNAADNAIMSMQYLRHDSHICWLWKTSDCRNRVNNSIKISK